VRYNTAVKPPGESAAPPAPAARSDIVVGLDVGTTKVCAIVGEVVNRRIALLGHGVAPCAGLQKGRIVDLPATISAIRAAIRRAGRAAGVEIATVVASLSGDHLRGENRSATVTIESGEILPADVQAVRTAARGEVPPDRVLLHHLPRTYRVDGQAGVRQPVGMAAATLAVESHLVTGARPVVENLLRALHRSDLEAEEVVAAAIATAHAVLADEEWLAGTLVADIGGGTTDVAVAWDGSIGHTAVLPVGGDHVTNDLSIGLRISRSEAEALKLQRAVARTSLVPASDYVTLRAVGDPLPREVPRRVVMEIVEPRVREMLELVRRELEVAAVDGVPVAKSVVLTGGAAQLPGLVELAREILGLPVRLGTPRRLPGDWPAALDQPYYSTAVGLLWYAARRRLGPEADAAHVAQSPVAQALSRLARWVRERAKS